MKKKNIQSFKEYLDIIDEITLGKHEIILYRGQNRNSPLLPSISRKDPSHDTTDKEIEMLEELKRRSQLTIKISLLSDWDWLVYAQHFGLKRGY